MTVYPRILKSTNEILSHDLVVAVVVASDAVFVVVLVIISFLALFITYTI